MLKTNKQTKQLGNIDFYFTHKKKTKGIQVGFFFPPNNDPLPDQLSQKSGLPRVSMCSLGCMEINRDVIENPPVTSFWSCKTQRHQAQLYQKQ